MEWISVEDKLKPDYCATTQHRAMSARETEDIMYYNDYFGEPTEFEIQFDGFRQSLMNSIKRNIKKKWQGYAMKTQCFKMLKRDGMKFSGSAIMTNAVLKPL